MSINAGWERTPKNGENVIDIPALFQYEVNSVPAHRTIKEDICPA
ncbi:MAG: hypothetical protein WC382_02205 [Methanoregulaceae archaeon]